MPDERDGSPGVRRAATDTECAAAVTPPRTPKGSFKGSPKGGNKIPQARSWDSFRASKGPPRSPSMVAKKGGYRQNRRFRMSARMRVRRQFHRLPAAAVEGWGEGARAPATPTT